MIKFEQFMEIQLLRQQGLSLRAIANQLALALGYEAVKAGIKVRFTSAAD